MSSTERNGRIPLTFVKESEKRKRRVDCFRVSLHPSRSAAHSSPLSVSWVVRSVARQLYRHGRELHKPTVRVWSIAASAEMRLNVGTSKVSPSAFVSNAMQLLCAFRATVSAHVCVSSELFHRRAVEYELFIGISVERLCKIKWPLM